MSLNKKAKVNENPEITYFNILNEIKDIVPFCFFMKDFWGEHSCGY